LILVVGRPPVREPVVLFFEQVMQQLGAPVDPSHHFVEGPRRLERLGGCRREWKLEAAASNVEASFITCKLDSAVHERLSVGLFQNGQQHFVANESGQRTPVDVEEPGCRARRAFPQHLAPECVVHRIRRHVIRDDIEHDAEPVNPQYLGQPLPRCLTAELAVDASVVHDVVAVRALRPRGIDGRQIHMADTQPCNVRNLSGKIVEGKAVR
jgi:hypothetical protein